MSTTACWHPLVRSTELRAGHDIVAAWVQGAELALWRTAGGVAQVWENRCPHRSVRFTLGQVDGDRLTCAYHGWQYAAGSGQCAAIPAHPSMAPPRNVCARTYQAAEASGMVWVHLGADTDESAPADAVPAGWHACRELAIRAGCDTAHAYLATHGWRKTSAAWAGELGGVAARALLLDAQPQLVVLHLWADTPPEGVALRRVHAAARRLRGEIEAAAL